MNRCFTNILCDDVKRSATFYQNLLGMTCHFSSDWFIILTHDEMPGLEFGLLLRECDIVPKMQRQKAQGIMITFVVNDCDVVCQKAKEMNTEVLEMPTDMPYGQRRMLIKDPEGVMLDISSIIKT